MLRAQDAGAEKGKGTVQGPVVWDMSKQDWVPAPKKAKQIAGPRSPRSGEAARPPGMKPSSVIPGFATIGTTVCWKHGVLGRLTNFKYLKYLP